MNNADITRSPRLQRVLEALSDGVEHSTLDLVREAEVCAVNSCIAELRANGAHIDCRQIRNSGGQRLWVYKLNRSCSTVALDALKGCHAAQLAAWVKGGAA